MTMSKTLEILQQQIDRLNQEQTETKWNERDKKLLEKFLGLVHDDPFRIFYADGDEVHRILELVYPEVVKEKIEELFRIKYIYDGFLKYGEVVKPQIEVERPNLEVLIKDISDHYLEIYIKQKKAIEDALKQARLILEKLNKKHYITMEDATTVLQFTEQAEMSMEDKVLVLTEILSCNNKAIQSMLKSKLVKKTTRPEMVEKENVVEQEEIIEKEPVVGEVKEEIIPKKEEIQEEVVEKTEPSIEEEKIEATLESKHEEIEESVENTIEEKNEKRESYVPRSSYTEPYLQALLEIDPTDLPTIHYVLPKPHKPNFEEIMNQLMDQLKTNIVKIKEEEQNSDAKQVRQLREELGRSQQLLKTLESYMERQEKNLSPVKEKIVEGEDIQLLLLENETGDSLIENDFKKQLDPEQYPVALNLLKTLEQFSDPKVHAKAIQTSIPGIRELSDSKVHVFFEPFAENTYIVIAILAEKNGYQTWLEDKLRLRHGVFQKQEKAMTRRWNQHGTRNTMLLGSEAAYLEMQDMAEKR